MTVCRRETVGKKGGMAWGKVNEPGLELRTPKAQLC